MLISKTIEMKWHSSNKKWYEDKGYTYTKMKDEFEVNVEDLPDGSNVFVEVECDGCGEILHDVSWYNYKRYIKADGKYYCKRCARELFGVSEKIRKTKLKNSISFRKWCYIHLPKNIADVILSRWDYELNIDKNGEILSPDDISYSSNGFNKKGYWFKCLDHPEHVSELKSINNFTQRQDQEIDITCNQCNIIALTHPHLVRYLVNKEDAYKHSYGTREKLLIKCPDCGYEKFMTICLIEKQGFGCSRCSDGISFPNKIMFNVLEQLKNLNKINEFETEKTFDWLKFEFNEKLRKCRLDFYFGINSIPYVVEMDGSFHSKDNSMNEQTKEESKFIDDEKDRLCREHDIEVIRIESLKSGIEYIRNNIMQSKLYKLLNFSETDIDWLRCHEFACNSLVKTACDLWSSGIRDITTIAINLKMCNATIRKYLKQGVELGWCDYNIIEEEAKRVSSMQKRSVVKVLCLNTGEIFNSIKEASDKYGVNSGSISACCRHVQKSAGRHIITNERLVWMYNEQYKDCI